MLRRHRRLFFPLAAALLALPLLAGLLAPAATEAVSAEELRPLAPPPEWPHGVADWVGFPQRLDAYLRDHFGLRRAMVGAYAWLVHGALRSGNGEVLVGADDHMFYRGEDQIEQSAGLLLRRQAIADVADMLAAMHRLLAARGETLIVASPPNAATIVPEDLPAWARNRGRQTEYDLLLADLAARGVPAIDLRPVLRAAKAQGPIYMHHDTHWTPRGALAAFDAIAPAAGLPDWPITPEAALAPAMTVTGGDLARMLGLTGRVAERMQPLALPVGDYHELGTGLWPSFERTLPGRGGPTVLIIGDSFTGLLVPPLLARSGHFVWIYHRRCAFDWRQVERLHAPQVWYMPTERELTCAPGSYPTGLAEAVAAIEGAKDAAR